MPPTDLPRLRQRPRAPSSGRSGMPALRLLPVVIAAAVFMLGVRIEVVVESIASARRPSLQVAPSTALAQAQPANAPAQQPATAQPQQPQQQAQQEQAGTPAEGAPAADAEPAATPPEAPINANFNPSSLTKSEIETLQRLAERRTQIEKREQDLAAREGLLKAGEARIDGKIAQLQELEKTIQGLLQQYDKQKQAEIEQLVRIYGAMKPKDAAGIFNTLDMPILVAVVQNMKETKVAPILSQMDREKARLLTEELSQRKQVGTAGG